MRILVVEDERQLCDDITEDLELERYTVERCYDGLTAWEHILVEPYNLVILDCAPVTFGHNVLVGPGCGFYTAIHPLHAAHRATGGEKAAPITVGSDVWFGGNVTVLPGVTIGDGAVIGAGSVVTRDIPPGVVAAGNPCRVLRPVDQEQAP